MAIGVVLAVVAIFLTIETKGLLIGESADPELVAAVHRLLAAEADIERVNEVLTLHQGPRDVLVTISVDFKDHVDAGRIESSVSAVETRIIESYPIVRRVFIEAQSWSQHIRRAAKD